MKTLTLLFLLVNLHLLAQSKQDTINFYPVAEFNLSFGKTELHFKQLETYDYKFAWDIFNLILNSPSNELGENGKPVNLNFNFIDMRSSNFFLNGRSLNGYIYPYQLFHMLPLDNIYKIEMLYNFSSPIFQNSNSSASNFIFKNIFTQRPITRVRYIEDAYDFIATDVSFTHNFHKNLNLTFGFRRSVSAGRFTNSQHDAWNFFINSFWIPLKNLKISLLNIYPFVKVENLSGEMSLNYGLGVEMNLKNLKPYAGFSHSHRIPTLFEQFISGSSDFEKHQVYEAGLKVKGGNFSLDIKIQNRRVFDFLVLIEPKDEDLQAEIEA